MVGIHAIRRPKTTSIKGSRVAPTPMDGEREEQFFDRAMRALRRCVPSVNRRTILVLKLWCDSINARELRDKSLAQFPADKFVHFGPRCVFIEHTVPASDDGQRPAITYDREALLRLVHWANYRILNSSNFAAISDGHTPSEGERASGVSMPDVLGYAGPFYLGLLGDVNPKWAIYADEWVHRTDVSRYERLQRRSPEVWINEPMERRTMDPIAALGAETPRLDSGMNPYSRVSDRQVVMRYSAMAFPGPANTFVPADGGRKQRYAGEFSMDDSTSATDDNSTPYLVNAVQAAVEALMPSIVQAVQQSLAATSSEPADDSVDDDVPAATDVELQGSDPDATPSDMDDDEKSHYQAMSYDCRAAYLAGRQKGRETMSYARSSGGDAGNVDVHKVVARQQAELNELRTRLERERREVERYSRLNNLAREFAFDVREETETCQDMTDSQFERHCRVTIAKYARRNDVTNVQLFNDPTLGPDGPGANVSRFNVEQIERYSREAASIAARKNAAKRGSTTFEAEFEAICKQHGLAV